MSAAAARAAFRRQAEFCAELGSPFTARLCALAAERLAPGGAVADRVLGWSGDPSNRADALPLRFAGALHALVVEGRIAATLAAAGARATLQAPIGWLRLEADDATPGAALTLALRPGGAPRRLARADFHGRWVDWRG
ncbi:DUF2332 family protein [Amaricoccus sp.]|uniref:DUF2332 family protein n=1 Tax=Amaricoccus sp. TaxID=1872485 RepID=UPI001B4C9E05|nr:DUF2332 family protein [Amaricoccus sp.]MBP7000005.1 DUF2332 family protein [Amaricoccus sp.]